MKPLGTTKAEADGLSASAPLSEPIRLPRPRPHDGGTVRKADTTLSRLPMPRPRPLGGGFGAQQETTTNNPTVPCSSNDGTMGSRTVSQNAAILSPAPELDRSGNSSGTIWRAAD